MGNSGVGKDGYGKGSLPREGFDWKKYEQHYIEIFHPTCKECGHYMQQRVGWFNKYYCDNKECSQYKKVILRSKYT